MRKKVLIITSFIAVLIMGLLVLAGCGNKSSENSETLDVTNNDTKNTDTSNKENDNKNKSKIGEYVHYNVNLGIGDASSVDDDWVVFYEDKDKGITYLIFAYFAPTANTTLQTIFSKIDFEAGDEYSVQCNQSHVPYKEINEETAERFLLSWHGTRDSNKLSMTRRLLDTDAWSGLVIKKEDGTAYDESILAIGTPTMELWLAAWAQRGYTPLYCATNEAEEATEGSAASQYGSGYYFAKTENPTQNDSIYFEYLDKTGYSSSDEKAVDKVFFPKTAVTDEGCNTYWIAAPTASSSPSSMFTISASGTYYQGTVYHSNAALRPVVSLSTSLIGNNSSSEIYYVGKNIND